MYASQAGLNGNNTFVGNFAGDEGGGISIIICRNNKWSKQLYW